MTLNAGQYLAPLNSGQVLSGYVQGVKEGTGITIQPDGTITLNPAGAATLGFLTSSSAPAPVFNWSLTPGLGGSLLRNDGAGNVNWTNDYVVVYPQGGTAIQTGAAALPAGTTLDRPPGAQAGWLRYNTSNGNPEFFNGGGWIATTRPQGPLLSFVSSLTPLATNPGDLWMDTNTFQEKVWDGVSWIPTSPAATSIIPGLVTTGANVQNTGGLISILDSTTAQKGVVQLNDTTTTNDPTLALTAAQGYSLQLQINALVISNNLTLAGLISGAGVMTYVTPEGTLTGFVLGNPLPAPGPGNEEYFVICESNGGFTPPGGAFTVVTQGDWFLSSGGVWVFLNVGADLPIASTTVAGIVRLSTNAETQTGTDNTIAVTPASLSSRVATETLSGLSEVATQAEANALVNDANFLTPFKLAGVFASGSITASDILVNPPINGNTVLDTIIRDAIYNIVSGNSSITIAETVTGQVDIIVAQATEVQIGGAEVATQAEANAGTNDATIITPLKLANVFASGSIDANDITLNPLLNGNTTVQQALGNAIYNIASSDNSIVVAETAVGQVDVTINQATTTQLGGAELATTAEALAGLNTTNIITPDTLRSAAVFKSDFNAKGDLLSASGNDIPVILPVGTDGQFLVANSLQSSGLEWQTLNASSIVVTPAINGLTNVQAVLTDAVYNIASSDNSIVVVETLTGQVDVTVIQATESQIGGGEIATQAEADAGLSDSVLITPQKLAGYIASGQIDASEIVVSPAINGNTDVQAALTDAVYNITSTGNTLGVTSAATGLFNLDVVQATTTQLGGAELATTAEALAGLNTTNIITPDTLRSAAVFKSDFNAKGDLLSASGNDIPVILPIGVDGQILVANSLQTTGLEWQTLSANNILVTPAINGLTNLNTILNDAVYNITSTGNTLGVTSAATGLFNLDVVQATTTQLGGAELATTAEALAGLNTTNIITPDTLRSAAVFKSDFNAKGDLLSAAGNNIPVILSIGVDGQILAVNSLQPSGLEWQSLNANSIVVTPAINGLTNLNTILNDAVYNIASSDNSIVISQTLTGQVDAAVIQATETQLGGAQVATQVETETGLLDTLIVTPLKLRTAAVYKSDFNAKGDILSAASNDSPLILPVGTTGQYLVVDPLAATGLKWYSIPNTTGVAGLVSNLGLTTITDNLTSVGSLDSALSANMGYVLQQQIDALVISNNLTLAGTINSLGVLVFVTTEGIAAGFVLGATLPVSSALNAEYYVICEQAGTITPPGGVATVVTQGDWFLSTGTGYQLLDVGYNAPNATTAIPGIVRLSTNAETQAGLNATIAVTPASLESRQATETLTGLIEIATQAEANTGTDDVRAVTPLKMRTSTVYQSDFNAKGDLLSASANDTPLILSVGADGAQLVADSTTATGLRWNVAAPAGTPYFATLDDISSLFNGVTTSFGLTIASVAYPPSPSSNIMVFLGGVAQTPGASNAYTVAGSTISFVSAPPTGTTFYATTVRS